MTLNEAIVDLTRYMMKELKIKKAPQVKLRINESNAQNFFGRTAYYDPNTNEVIIYTSNRHPKDCARSYAHELIHHHQNERGEFSKLNEGYAQEDNHLRKMEEEAYLKGNILFRDWEDGIKDKHNG